MRSSLATIGSTPYVKLVFGALLAFVAVIAGVIVGSALTGTLPVRTEHKNDDLYTSEGQPPRMPEEY